MKRIVALLLIFMFAFSVAACGEEPATASPQKTQNTQIPTTQQIQPTEEPLVTTTITIVPTEPILPTEEPAEPTTIPTEPATTPTEPATKPTEPVHVHTWRNATCVDPKICSECGETEGKPLGHTWQNATCTTPKTCAVCNVTEGEVLSHAWDAGIVLKEATEYTDGEMLYTCSACGQTKKQPIPPTGHIHDYTETAVTPPTCSQNGFTTYSCRCGDSYTDSETSALGHSWQKATCTTPKTCATCGETSGTAAGHNWNAAMCTNPKTCKTCGVTEGKAAGHNYKKNVTDPTCTDSGYTTYTCATCQDSYVADYVSARGHDWKAATCTSPKTCGTCSKAEGSSLGHNYVSGVCERCGDKTTTTSSFSIHFIDVGQADAALVECDGHYMLIDGGNKADSNIIYTVLKNAGVQKLDIVVGTHAHEDHIGGLPGAFNYTTADLTLCPVTSYDSDAFDNFVKYANQKGGGITIPKVGDTYKLGSATITILGVNAGKDPNDSSIILRIDYGKTSFLFAGDAERAAEQAALDSGLNLSATVLKVGHHGGNDSTTYPFLREIMPEYAVISVGSGNSYGHPTEGALSRLRDADVKLFRTDMQGDIFCTSDGETVTFSVTRNADADVFEGLDKEDPGTDPDQDPDTEYEGLQILSWPKTIGRNEIGTVKIQGKANTEYTITVYYKSGPSTADGLEAKISDSNGCVAWSWKVGGRTSPGTYKIVVEGGGETITVEFTVTA